MLWAELDAARWSDLYDECNEDPSTFERGTSHEFEFVDGDLRRTFFCEGSNLPAPFSRMARAISSEAPEANELPTSLTVATSQRAVPRPSELGDGQIGDCDGMEVRWQTSEKYGAAEFVAHCDGDRPVYWDRYAGFEGWGKKSSPVPISQEAWARLWSTLTSLDWRHLSSSCPAPAPGDSRASSKASGVLSITDQHGSRTMSCHGWGILPEPYATFVQALEAVSR
ncbi:hypothetical protein ENSA7_80170 [Enhygromyxa salina]|uniref:Uncharacterized protein n=1 Tax=Enhygromyxa salina TaxID=215803 RepID=A0A2S9XL40_9BACT|nr:hypothetical protein ENSA7_80170 [Enhygromyxa salina]